MDQNNQSQIKELKKIEETGSLYFMIYLIAVGVLSRMIPHPWNMTAIGSMALFSGFSFPKSKWIKLSPFISLMITDFILGTHYTMFYTYLSFALMMGLGHIFAKQARTFTQSGKWSGVGFLSVVGSLLFFFITNTGVWYESNIYSSNFSGWVMSLVAGLPFLFNQIAGDLFYSCLFGLGLVIIQKKLMMDAQKI